MSNISKVSKNCFINSFEISQFEQMIGKKAFNGLVDVYEKIISENKDAEIINELLKIFFSAGYIKWTKDTQDFLS